MNNEKREITLSLVSVFKACLLVSFFVLAFYLRDLILLLVTALVIASAIDPLASWFERHQVRRVPAVLLIYIVAIIGFGTLFYFLAPVVVSEVSSLLSTLPRYFESFQLWGERSGEFLSQNVPDGIASGLSTDEIIGKASSYLVNLSGGFLRTISGLFGGIVQFVLLVIISFYLSIEKNGVANFLKVISPASSQDYIVSLWHRTQRKIGLWMQGQLILMATIGTIVTIVLWALGIKHAFLFGALAGILEIIPIFGPILGAIPAVIVGFSQNGITTALILIAIFIIIQQLENNLLQPLIVRKVVGVPPLIVIISIVTGGTLAGFLGVLLSVPIATFIMELADDLLKEKDIKKLAEKK